MSRLVAMVAALTLSGCASFTEAAKRHPYVTGFVITSLAVSGAQALKHRDESAPAALIVSTPGVDCSKVSCQ